MNKRFATIFTIAVATILVGSVSYASKKKLKTKSKPPTSDISEADLAAVLLDVKGDNQRKSPIVVSTHGDVGIKELTVKSNK